MRTPYELEPEPPAPDLPGTVVVRADAEEVLDAACGDLLVHAAQCVREFGDFHLVVSARGLAARACVRLMVDPLYRGLPWARAHVWVAEEWSAAPESDERSAWRAIAGLLGEHAGMNPEHVHPLGDGGAGAYAERLRERLAWRERGQDRPDFALLGPVELARSLAAGGEELYIDAGASDGVRAHVGARLLGATRFVGVVADRVPATQTGSAAMSGLGRSGNELRWYVPREPSATPGAPGAAL